MRELIEKVEQTKKRMAIVFHELDTFNTELDIDKAGVNLEKFEKRIANLRKEWEIEYSYLQKENK